MIKKNNISDDCLNCLDYIHEELKECLTEEDGIMVIPYASMETVFENLKKIHPSDCKQSKESDVCLHSRVCRFRFVSDPDCKNVGCSSFMRR